MYKQIAANKRKTVLIMALFVGFVAALGWLLAEYLGSSSITPYIIGGTLVYVILSYYFGSRLSLAVNGAHEIQKKDNPRLWRIVENLAITEGLPTPKVYIIDDPALNAFATGRNPSKSAVCATTGLLDSLNDTELEGVMAHELGHIKNYDMRVAMVAFALVAVVSIMVDIIWRVSWFRDNDEDNSPLMMILGLVAIILAPLIAALIQLAISRRREYLADATGALTTRYPEGLISALQKIKDNSSTLRRQNASTAHFFFANPLKGKGLAHLFSTHPPVEERIRRLRHMGSHA
jgi:heat shock protein HtpX